MSRCGRSISVPAMPAEQLTPPLFAGRLGDELVWAAASVVGHRQHAPLRPERRAASGEGGARDVCRGGSTEHEHVDPFSPKRAPDARHDAERADRQPRPPHPRTQTGLNDRRRSRFWFRCRGWCPRLVAVARRQRGPRAGLQSPPQDDPQRDERHHDDHQLLDPDARRLGQENRQREPDDVECEVQHDPGQ